MTRKFIIVLSLICMPLFVFGQPLADHVPGDAIIYAGWAGPTPRGYGTSHLKAVLDASDIHQFISEFIPAARDRLFRANPKLAEKVDLIYQIELQLLKHPCALYVSEISFKQGQPPNIRFTVLCDAGDESADLLKSLNHAISEFPVLTSVHIQAGMQGNLVALSVGEPDKTEGALADLPAFKHTMESLQTDSAAAIYVNIDALVQEVDQAETSESTASERAMWTRIKAATGLAGVHAFAWTGKFDHRNWVTEGFLDAPEPRSGLLAGVGGRISDQTLKMIPRSAITAGACQFNVAQFMDNLRQVLGEVNPKAQQQFDRGLGFAKMVIGADVKTDLIDSLGDQWVYYVSPEVAGNGALGMVFLNKLTDPAKEQHALESVELAVNNFIAGKMSRPGQKMTIRFRTTTYHGLEIHYLDIPLVTPSWAIDHGTLYVGFYPQVIIGAQALEDAGGESILDNPKFSKLRESLGGQTASAVRFIDCEANIDNGYPAWLAISRYAAMSDIFGMATPPILLPPLQSIKSQLTPMMRVGWWDKTGWHSKADSAFPGAGLLSDPTTLIGVGSSALMVSILLPSLNHARETANRIKCASNMRQIGEALMLYSNDHQGKYPPDLGTLILTEEISAAVFICPDVHTPMPNLSEPEAIANWVNHNTDYIYLGKGKTNSTPADDILLYEKPSDHGDGMNILFADGHVDFDSLASANEMIEKQTGAAPK